MNITWTISVQAFALFTMAPFLEAADSVSNGIKCTIRGCWRKMEGSSISLKLLALIRECMFWNGSAVFSILAVRIWSAPWTPIYNPSDSTCPRSVGWNSWVVPAFIYCDWPWSRIMNLSTYHSKLLVVDDDWVPIRNSFWVVDLIAIEPL